MRSPIYSLVDVHLLTGIPGQISALIFIGVLVFSAMIVLKRLDYRVRSALIPLSLVPLLLGISGTALSASEAIRRVMNPPNPAADLVWSPHELLYLLVVTAAESAILLTVTSLLMIFTPRTGKETCMNNAG